MNVEYKKYKFKSFIFSNTKRILSKRLQQALEELNKPFFYDLSNLDKGAQIVFNLKKILLDNNS